MSSYSEPPPAFISDKKSYAEYKKDLEMWSRITSLDPKLQAEVVVYRLEGDPSRIKEKIFTQIGEKLKENARLNSSCHYSIVIFCDKGQFIFGKGRIAMNLFFLDIIFLWSMKIFLSSNDIFYGIVNYHGIEKSGKIFMRDGIGPRFLCFPRIPIVKDP